MSLMTDSDSAIDALCERIAHARAQPPQARTPLRVQGGASKDFIGTGLTGDVLSTQGLQGILSYEPTELVVTVRAGTPLRELQAVLAEKNQCLPFEPPHFGSASATVGGMVASGLSGPARASAGACKDFVLGASVLNGRGELLRFGGQVMKNVAGYDVSRVLAGSWGTLGVITEVSLKVLGFSPCEATVRARLDQAPALALLHRWGGQPLPLNASCWLSEADGAYLYVRLRGAQAAVQAALMRMQADLHSAGTEGQSLDPAQAQTLWDGLRDQRHAFFASAPSDACLWRLSVAQTAPVLDVPYAQCLEWQGGQRWLWAPASAAATLHAAARAAGGHATLFRRPAGALADVDVGVPVWSPLEAAAQRIHTALQSEFDPDGVFNTGRLHGPA